AFVTEEDYRKPVMASHRVGMAASEKYYTTLNSALSETDNQKILSKLKKMKKMVDEKKMMGDWESWMQQKTAGNDDKVYKDGIDNSDSDNNFIERRKENQLTTHRSWVLKSGTNVGDELAKYIKAIPKAHKCLK
ncbi:11772_t:CDS:2, partial [Racocetra persica]